MSEIIQYQHFEGCKNDNIFSGRFISHIMRSSWNLWGIQQTFHNQQKFFIGHARSVRASFHFFMHISNKYQKYIMHISYLRNISGKISGISDTHLRHISGVSQTYLGIRQTYIEDISDTSEVISQVYLSHFWAYLIYISHISWANQMLISGILQEHRKHIIGRS